MDKMKVWPSRKIARKIAHARMRRDGIIQPNKEKFGVKGQMIVRFPSFFASNWQRYAAK